MLANKNPAAIVAPLSGRLASINVVPVEHHAHHAAEAFGANARQAANLQETLNSLTIKPGERVLIAGSLYLAGEALKLNDQLPD